MKQMLKLKHIPDKSWELDKQKEYNDIIESIEYQSAGKHILPEESDNSGIFYALELTPLDKTKVLIIGQDPYPNPDRAQGISFSFRKNLTAEDSLSNMFSKINDAYKIENTCTDLTCWAKQGVLLLNTSLTFTEKNTTKAWNKFWKPVVNYVINKLIDYKKNRGEPLIIMLWGCPANEVNQLHYKKDSEFKNTNIKILRSSHPSNNYGACRKGIYKGSEYEAPAFMSPLYNPFKECNDFLKSHGEKEIDWHTHL